MHQTGDMSETYLEPYWTSIIELSCESSWNGILNISLYASDVYHAKPFVEKPKVA